MQAAGIVIALIALLLAIGAIALATVANRRLMRRAGAGPQRAARRESLSELQARSAELAEQVQALGAALGTAQEGQSARDLALTDVGTRLEQLAEQQAAQASAVAAAVATAGTALRRVAIVRYDAFADVGGRLSHSTAILDDTGSGLVITALSGKADIRTYVKAVSAGAGESQLTPEEDQAVSAAMSEGANP